MHKTSVVLGVKEKRERGREERERERERNKEREKGCVCVRESEIKRNRERFLVHTFLYFLYDSFPWLKLVYLSKCS